MRWLILTVVFLIVVGLNLIIRPQPVLPGYFSEPLVLSRYFLRDLFSVVSGLRRLGADIAWIDLLQYYGTPEDLSVEEKLHHSLESLSSVFGWELECHHSFEGGLYPELLSYCQRIVRLDPNFLYAYQFGAASLAWNQNRTEEAILLLKEAIKKHPQEEIFPMYLAAIVYRKELKEKEFLDLLLDIAEKPQTPNIVKVIAANFMEKQKKYLIAWRLWLSVWRSGDAMYQLKSEQKLRQLGAIYRTGRSP